ncbi:MAG: hypothetical protein RLZZ623_2795 [Actinomycetota bacterium]|jgi:hypothetical protein
MIRAVTYLQAWCLTLFPDASDRSEHSGERDRDTGQATTEYALVMLGASAIALLVITWATAGGGAGRVGRLFDRVIDAVVGRI